MTLHPGKTLGPFRLVEKIGEGGMGVVWKARDTSLDRDVALKVLPEAFARDPERLARFQREAKAVAALAHPGILGIHGFGDDDGTVFAVMELLEGRTLREDLRAGPLPPERAIAIARAVAEGLAAAHDRGIVHRDLKPENLFLTREGRTKILDFGIAALVGSPTPGDDETPTRTSLTIPGVLIGTTGYLSPEQIRGGTIDVRSDLFSLGIVIWEMLAGSRPFSRETENETMAAILRDPPPPLPRNVSRALERTVLRCLEKSPDRRFASARELGAALEAQVAATPSSRGRRIAVGVGVAVVLAAAAWETHRRVTAPEPAPGPFASVTSIGDPLSSNLEASEYFEKGMLFLRSQLDLTHAQDMFARAVEIDPSFGAARAMLGLTRLIAIHEGFSNDGTQIYESERTSREVVGEQPEMATAHAVLGAAMLYSNRREAARTELRRALQIDPRAQSAIVWLAIDARVSGRADDAEAGCRSMLATVPLFWVARVMLAESLFEGGRAGEARRELEKVFEQDPDNLVAKRVLARVDLHEGDLAAARARLESIGPATHPNFRVRLTWALLLALEGKRHEAVAILDPDVQQYGGLGMFAAWQVAEVYAVAGRYEEAFHWLDQGVRNGDQRAAWLRRNGFVASLRGQARFELILEAIERGGTTRNVD